MFTKCLKSIHKITDEKCNKIGPNHPTQKPRRIGWIFKFEIYIYIYIWNSLMNSMFKPPNCQQKSISQLAKKKTKPKDFKQHQ